MKVLAAKRDARWQAFAVYLALWLLDRSSVRRAKSIKRVAGALLKKPARQGSVTAQRRLGQLLYQDCPNRRDRRIGLELLEQAARAGDRQALGLLNALTHPRDRLRRQAGQTIQRL